MIKFKLKEIADITGGSIDHGDSETVVSGFSIDSRDMSGGGLFIAVKGDNFDGHDYLDEAARKGASGLLVERSEDRNEIGTIVVANTRKAMGLIAAEIRRRVNVPVICVTGTNGKTTLKDMLHHILSVKYRVLKSRKSYNNLIGLSLTLFELDTEYDIAVLELGSSHAGEIRELSSIARPDVAVITNIGRGHLEFFGDLRGVFDEKISMLENMNENGVVFLNKDDELLSNAATGTAEIRYFGKSTDADLRISDAKRTEAGYDFRLDGEDFFIPFDGEHNVYNASAAVAIARHFGVDAPMSREALKSVILPEMRMEKIQAGDITFINDSYNANPDSFESALEVLCGSDSYEKRGIVAGEMMELGAGSRGSHDMLGRSIAEKGIDFLITLGGMSEAVAEGAVRAGMPEEAVFIVRDHNEAADIVGRNAVPGTIVLLKGSRASKMEEVLKCYTISCTR